MMKLKYKSKQPQETIEKILSILEFLNIDIELLEIQNDAHTYSCNIKAYYKGIYIGHSNGKGKTKDFALASGLAEFMERLSNDFFTDISTYCIDKELSKKTFDNFGFNIHHNEKSMLLTECSKQTMFKELFKTYGSAIFLSYMENGKLIDKHRYCFPFTNILTNEVNYMPFYTTNLLTGSEGLVAGNSFEEAMIEGISELMERLAVREIIVNDIDCPNINIEILKEYTELHNIVLFLQKNDFSVQLKDYSCGGKYPAIALVVTDLKSGQYAVNVATNPVFHIAVERCFTEIFQNQDINIIRRMLIPPIAITNNEPLSNRYHSYYKNGKAKYPEKVKFQNGFATNLSHFIFDKNEELSTIQIFDRIKEILKNNGINCWVKDSSYYGFNCYKVIFSNKFCCTSFVNHEEMEMLTEHELAIMPLKSFLKNILDSKTFITKDMLDQATYIINNNLFNLQMFNSFLVSDLKTSDKNLYYLTLFTIFFFYKKYTYCEYCINNINRNFFISPEINLFYSKAVLIVNQSLNHKGFQNIEKAYNYERDKITQHRFNKNVTDINNYLFNKEELTKEFFYHLHEKEYSLLKKEN